jgi:hypothetical protein
MTNTPGAISLIALGSTIGAGGTALGEVSLIDAASIVVRFHRLGGSRNWTFQA